MTDLSQCGLQFAGVDPLQAGNVVQLLVVLGMTVGWIFSYMFRVANKDMTYAQQLRDYESKVMEVGALFPNLCMSVFQADPSKFQNFSSIKKENL